MTFTDDELRAATQKILPLGYKPEDYAVVGMDIAVAVARMIAEEILFQRERQRKQAEHAERMARRREELDLLKLQWARELEERRHAA